MKTIINSKKKKLVIIGHSVLAQIAYEYFTWDTPYEVVAFVVEKEFITKDTLFGLPILPYVDLEALFSPEEYKVFVGISYVKRNKVRTRLYKDVKKKGYEVVSYISSKAFIWKNVEIGENCFIFENCIIQPFAKIGNNVIIWCGTNIGHHVIVRDNCFFSINVSVSGFTEIKENCWFGINSTVGINLKIAKDTVVGGGALILKDTEEKKFYRGYKSKSEEYSLGVKKMFNLETDEDI